jgi:outer membrane protein
MKTRIAIAAIACSLTVAAAAAAQPAGAAAERLSLAEAIRLATEQSAEVQTARLEVEKAEADVAVAKTRRLPIFETSVSASQLLSPVTFHFPEGAFGTFPGVGPIPDTDTTVEMKRQPILYATSQISQPLSQLFKINLRLKSTSLARDAERERVREARAGVSLQVKRLYLAILQSRSALAAIDADVTFARELQRTVEARAAERVVLPGDVLDVRLKLAQAELDRTTTEHTLAGHKEQLNRLLGRDVTTAFDVEDVPPPSLFEGDAGAARARAVEQRSDVRRARLALKRAELEERITRASRIPDVSVAVGYTAHVNMDVLPSRLATAGIQASWEPFDWGRRKHEVAGKAHAVRQARLAIRDAEDRAAIDVHARLRALAEKRGVLQVASLAEEAARERLRVKTNQFEQQAALLPDVLHLRAELAGAADRHQQARLALWVAKADFDHALGEE